VIPSASPAVASALSGEPVPQDNGAECAMGPAVPLEHPQRRGVGTFLLGVLDAPLSAAPEQAPHAVLRGSPALVVDVVERNGRTWRRVVAADGSMGWLDGVFIDVPGEVIIAHDAELTDRVAAANSSLDGIQQVPIAGGSAVAVLEASDVAYPETMAQLGTQNYLDSDWLPWLRVRFESKQGWLAPSETRMAWATAEGRQCFSWHGFGGLVRAGFLSGADRALAAFAPRAGEPVRYILRGAAEPWPPTASCPTARAAFFEKSDEPPRAVLFQCNHPEAGKIQVLAGGPPARRFFVFDEERATRMVRAEAVNLAGSPNTLILELALQSSHDDEHVLFGPDLPSDATASDLVPLATGDSIATWVADVTRERLTIVRTSRGGMTTDFLTVKAGHFAATRGYSVVLSIHATLLDAQRAVLLDSGSQLIGLGYPTKSWARARSYPTRAEACRQLAASKVPAHVMRSGPNLSCSLNPRTPGQR